MRAGDQPLPLLKDKSPRARFFAAVLGRIAHSRRWRDRRDARRQRRLDAPRATPEASRRAS
jgi:hypothetical protein